ncbi:MAG: DUF6089 family protein [Bacteroidota bacterium]|jgi:hypothetical protein
MKRYTTRATLIVLLGFYMNLGERASAQSYEVGIFGGVSTYKGELQQSLFDYRQSKPAVGVLIRKNLNNHWAQRIALNFGTIAASDSKSDEGFKKNRNLSFRSRVLDIHYLIEFNFFPYQIANPATFFTPFVFAGINVFQFNPQAEFKGEWYDLQPLGTEGQGTSSYPDRKKYNRVQVAIPIGGGLKFKISRRFGATIEAGARRTYTDYLDDVSTTYADKSVLLAANGELSAFLSDRSLDGQSIDNTNRQRGNASDNDWYMFTGISLNYTLSKKYSDNCKPFRGKLR